MAGRPGRGVARARSSQSFAPSAAEARTTEVAARSERARGDACDELGRRAGGAVDRGRVACGSSASTTAGTATSTAGSRVATAVVRADSPSPEVDGALHSGGGHRVPVRDGRRAPSWSARRRQPRAGLRPAAAAAVEARAKADAYAQALGLRVSSRSSTCAEPGDRPVAAAVRRPRAHVLAASEGGRLRSRSRRGSARRARAALDVTFALEPA